MPYFGGLSDKLSEFNSICDDITRNRGPIMVRGCLDSQKAHLISEMTALAKKRLVITYSETQAHEIYDDLRCFDKDVLYYPIKDLLFFDADVKGNEVTAARIRVLKELVKRDSWTVVTTINACMEPLPSLEDWAGQCITVDSSTVIDDTAEFARKLVELGYRREAQAESQGQFAIRGGMIDIFPLCEDNPFRIELWGDEIDSIRVYDALSQRSLGTVEAVEIFPASQELFGHGKEDALSFISYAKDALIFLDEPLRVYEMSEAIKEEFVNSLLSRKERGLVTEKTAGDIWDFNSLIEFLSTPKTILMTGISNASQGIPVKKNYMLEVHGIGAYGRNSQDLIDDLTSWTKGNWRIVLLSSSTARANRLAEQLRDDHGLKAWYSDDLEKPVMPGEIMVAPGNIHRGFSYPDIRLIIIPDNDMFGTQAKKKKKRREEKVVGDYTRFAPGDFVVHENHGMGIYRGIEKIEIDKVVKDYIKLEYAKGGVLYLPVTQSDLLQKYSGGDGHRPRLNSLGGQEWKKTKARVRSAVNDIAKELVELYAVRQSTEGYEFAADTEWQKEFEEMFPFELTDDQTAAITEVKSDMESKRIMDRLICGDVGFGKTEVAIRAAFKAVQSGKQVAFLVPTTVLAQQHTRTFRNRLESFAVNIGELSRFQSPAEQKKIIAGLKDGSVDIVVGTHRLLSADVAYKDLGLLIIDEEQRFGVAHKEKIKQMKSDVDTMALTATPIPRTLHMSLIGIRDMSVLAEPPQDRVPVQTYVMEFHEELAREAIRRELDRGGQVYYVFNRVKGIAEFASRIQTLVPDARVAYAHGQMAERKLEQVMVDFVNGEIDVLVSTTIIETGLDIANVNTILVQNADYFGLSQLYQLKGRVGRSNRTAYAFLFYGQGKMLREEAEKRLRAIRDFTELGSGIRIAMKDLEIRGAGNILGGEQHGHIEAVGYDLYCKLLNEAIMALKGGDATSAVRSEYETAVDLNVDAYIPDSYIAIEPVKMEIYKRISSITSEDDTYDVTDELIDRFGQPPEPVVNLLDMAFIRAVAHKSFMTDVSLKGHTLTMKMFPHALVDTSKIPVLVNAYAGRLRFVSGTEPAFVCSFTLAEMKTPKETISSVRELVLDIAQSLVG